MKILIVGGTSSVGKALSPVLSEFSEIVTAGRNDCDIYLDLGDPIEKMSIPGDIDALIHTAAHFGGKKPHEIIEAENINALGTLKLCELAVKAQVKHFIFISSIFSSLTERSEHYNIYTVSKKHAEELAQFYCSQNSMPLTILKPSQIYGNEEEFGRHQPFFYNIVRKAQNNEDINLYGSHDAMRNFIHIEDLANIIARVVQQKIYGNYLCTQKEDIRYSEIAGAALKAFNSNKKVSFLKDKPDIPDNIFEKDFTLYDKIGFSPRISIAEGMKKIASHRLSNS